jgi:trehalose synthase
MATDDPEGMKIYQKVAQSANNLIESGDVILITSENNILVNSLQRFSDVIIQKSIREGFGLVVAEALWKQAAVVASNVGGIPLQVIDEDGFAERIIQLMKDKELAKKLGRNAKEHIRTKFLITRLLSNYLDLIRSVLL